MQGETKTHLREFQERLSERLRNASGTSRAARLGLAIGDQRGLVNLRGTLFGVSDLMRFSGDVFTPVSKESRLLALAGSLNLNAALVVTRMLGLHDSTAWRPDPSRAHWASWAGRCLVDGDGRDWYELSLSRLAGDEQFLSVGRQ